MFWLEKVAISLAIGLIVMVAALQIVASLILALADGKSYASLEESVGD